MLYRLVKAGIRYLLIFVMISGMLSCSPEVGKKTLRFFFDGVPEESSQQRTATADSSGTADSLKALARINPHKAENIYHLPYREKQCDACHDQSTMGKFVEVQPALCYQCHEDFSEKYKVIHGPVSGGYCTACHNPHFAKDSTLLKREGQDMCRYCHQAGLSFDVEIHDGIDDTSCTECHNPHGGDSRELLN